MGCAERTCGQNTCKHGCSLKFIMDLLLFLTANVGEYLLELVMYLR